jgi:thioredoxin-related protein
MKTTSIVCAAVMALIGTSHAGGEGWSTDYEASKKLAAESKKDLLIDFTGSDWCGWCIKLNDEVFKHDAFKTGVKDTFVLVELDFPNDKSKLSEKVQKQNEELGEKYAVQGYPSIVLCDAGGRPYAATGYQKGGPEKYVEHLNELKKKKAERDEAFAKAAKTEGLEKAKALIAALEAMELEDATVANFYGEIVAQIIAADGKDETGFARKTAAAKRLAEFQSKLQELGEGGDMDGAMALVDKTLKEGGFDKEVTFNLMMTRVMILSEQKKFDDAIKALDEVKAADPANPMVGQLDQFRKKLEEDKAEAAGDSAKEKEAPAKEE